MPLRRIATIFMKDLRDATRDARVLIALLIPIGIGLFYGFTFDDEDAMLVADVAYTTVDETTLPSDLTTIIGDVAVVRFARFDTAEQVRRQVENEEADLGLVLPAGFDAAVAAGQRPEIVVFRQARPTLAGDYVTAALEPAIRLMAGQLPPATIAIVDAGVAAETATAIDKLGLRTWSIVASLVMMVALIAMLAVPIILAEEGEKKTLDALVLVASYAEVVLAKALVGLFYVLVMVPLLLFLTGVRPVHVPLFVLTMALLAVTLMGLGLLMAGLFKSANQLNTWSGIVLLPVIMPAFIVGLPAPAPVETAATLLPSGAGAKLIMNALAEERIYGDQTTPLLVLVAWSVLGYGLLLWQLSRRQA